ncbi:MAG: HAD family hydrolase [Gemmatimonadota bacterium]|nr:HAD family hydrolase [Gemmatimonadota bacterium]
MTSPARTGPREAAPEPAEEVGLPPVLRDAGLVFWDFDGVVKDSVEVKSDGFRWIVRGAGDSIANRVQRHHEANGGTSRFEKIPLYLSWAGMSSDAAAVRRACSEFSRFVVDAVIDSPWVPGVRDYLVENRGNQVFILVTATPADEIGWILERLDLLPCFSEVHGAPMAKADAVSETLARHLFEPDQSVFIGDSESDHRAATSNNVPFLLRRHRFNDDLIEVLDVPSFSELSYG